MLLFFKLRIDEEFVEEHEHNITYGEPFIPVQRWGHFLHQVKLYFREDYGVFNSIGYTFDPAHHCQTKKGSAFCFWN